jgi:hypothetical protein
LFCFGCVTTRKRIFQQKKYPHHLNWVDLSTLLLLLN